jgi:MFS family permease
MVLLTLAAGQFLMTLDSSVMNVSIATVAKDVGTSVTGIQGAITLYTLVMAMLTVTGSKVGSRPGPSGVRGPTRPGCPLCQKSGWQRSYCPPVVCVGLGSSGCCGTVDGVCW